MTDKIINSKYIKEMVEFRKTRPDMIYDYGFDDPKLFDIFLSDFRDFIATNPDNVEEYKKEYTRAVKYYEDKKKEWNKMIIDPDYDPYEEKEFTFGTPINYEIAKKIRYDYRCGNLSKTEMIDKLTKLQEEDRKEVI